MWASIATCLVGAALVGFGFLSAAQRSDTGAITHAGPMAWNDLQAGDCFNFRDEGDTVDQVDAVLCADAHVYEVFWVGEAPDGEFPTTDEVATFAEDTCSPAFADYVGHEIETSVWYASYVAPGEDAWNAGEHTIVCHLFNSTETPVEGSAAGSAQ